MKLRANAKINLFLRVAGIDKRGFHILDSLVFSVDIFDTVEINVDFKANEKNGASSEIEPVEKRKNASAAGNFIEKYRKNGEGVSPEIRPDYEKSGVLAVAGNSIEKYCVDVSLEMSKSVSGKNNALAAAERLSEKYRLPRVDISIEKKIPIAAGLGGSSADTAAVVFGFGKLFGVPLEGSLEFGDDVPFMLSGGAAAVCGGEDLLSEKREIFIGALKKYTFLVAKPFGEMLTGEVFRVYDGMKKTDKVLENCGEKAKKTALGEAAITLCGENKSAVSKSTDGIKKSKSADILKLIDGIIAGDRDKIRENLSNDLYAAAAAISPNLERVRGELLEAGAFACVMTGSGNAFVGLFEESAAAERAAKSLKGYEELILCRAAERGIVEC
jgi:4-diphosphocytidyl-2-C-methyl-D-erythritol kinase